MGELLKQLFICSAQKWYKPVADAIVKTFEDFWIKH